MTHYARSGEVSIAWQADGAGPLDVIVVPGIVSHIEAFHELPGYTRFLRQLGAFARIITFDKRGNGLSDRVSEPPSLEERMDDVRAVLDAAESKRAVVLGISEGGPMSILFARAHPERTAALVLFGSFARILSAPGYDAGLPRAGYEAFTARTVETWGTGAPLVGLFGPSLEGDTAVRAIAAKCERMSATPTTLRALWRMNASIDVRDELGKIPTPTLLLHRSGDRVIPAASSRWMAAQIPHAELVVLEGDDHFPFVGDGDRVVSEVARFLGGTGVTKAVAPAAKVDAAAVDDTQLARLSTLARIDEPIVIGRFVVERAIGAGGMGSVFLARDRDLSRRVAIKVLRAADANALRRFRREAVATARLSHPNVVAIHDLGLEAKVPYIVMEYLAGGAASRIERVGWARACALVASAARGLGAAHALGMVHRDVKPGNLLLADADADEVKVADFGIAKLGGADPLTREGVVLGTIGFLAPEQVMGGGVDPRCDVYALGVTLYRLLTGRAPIDGTPAEMLAAASRPIPDPSVIVPDLPSGVVDLVRTLSAVDPRERPADGAAAAEAIQSVM
jgi:pimeloyl-ACP methyl ester carboxylesterase